MVFSIDVETDEAIGAEATLAAKSLRLGRGLQVILFAHAVDEAKLRLQPVDIQEHDLTKPEVQ